MWATQFCALQPATAPVGEFQVPIDKIWAKVARRSVAQRPAGPAPTGHIAASTGAQATGEANECPASSSERRIIRVWQSILLLVEPRQLAFWAAGEASGVWLEVG